jgi:hypothetical protein
VARRHGALRACIAWDGRKLEGLCPLIAPFTEPLRTALMRLRLVSSAPFGKAPPARSKAISCPTNSMPGGSSGPSPGVMMTLSISARAASNTSRLLPAWRPDCNWATFAA